MFIWVYENSNLNSELIGNTAMFYFLLTPYEGPTKARYQHSCVLVAEGLKKLGHSFGGNIDYFPDPSGNFAISHVDYTEQEYIITSAPEEFDTQIKQFLRIPGRKLIIIDTKDEGVRPLSRQYAPIAHRYFLSSATSDSKMIVPWVFGATSRMIDSVRPSPWAERKRSIAWTHRVDNHQIRNHVKGYYDATQTLYTTYIDKFKVPEGSDLHFWNHTGRRHSTEYFKFIGQHTILDAHGGYSIGSKEIVQWDSWKVWEGFLSGCLVVTADLEYYGIVLPFPLVPFEHYIPVRYDQLEASYEKLWKLSDAEQQRIAAAGRAHILQHYTPERLAAYMVKRLH
jgi:hypothetical protein